MFQVEQVSMQNDVFPENDVSCVGGCRAQQRFLSRSLLDPTCAHRSWPLRPWLRRRSQSRSGCASRAPSLRPLLALRLVLQLGTTSAWTRAAQQLTTKHFVAAAARVDASHPPSHRLAPASLQLFNQISLGLRLAASPGLSQHLCQTVEHARAHNQESSDPQPLQQPPWTTHLVPCSQWA